MSEPPYIPKGVSPPPLPLGEQSAERESAFSKPGSTKSAPSKGWKPAKGVRFRSTIEKARGRRRTRPRDKRRPVYY